MKFKKLFVLPLLAVTLASCELIPLNTSTPDENITSESIDDSSTSLIDTGGSTSDDISTPSGGASSESSEPGEGSDPENNFRDADLLVLGALLDFAQTDFSELDSLDLTLAVEADFALGRYEFLEDDDFLTTIIELDGSGEIMSNLKIADFTSEDPKLSAEIEFDINANIGEDVIAGVGDLALFYQDEWMYGYSDVALNDAFRALVPLGMPEGEQKIKQKVGAPDGLFDEFDPLDIESVPVEEILEMMLHATDLEIIPHSMGTQYKYSIDFDFVLDFALAMFAADLDDDLSSEEMDDIIDMMGDLFDELFDFDHADISLLLDNDDALIGVELDLAAALIIPEGDDIFADEAFDYREYQRTEIDIALEVGMLFNLNGAVTVDYPSDLSTYVEGVIIPN